MTEYAAWGRCRSGKRWFWFATLYNPPDVPVFEETAGPDPARNADRIAHDFVP